MQTWDKRIEDWDKQLEDLARLLGDLAQIEMIEKEIDDISRVRIIVDKQKEQFASKTNLSKIETFNQKAQIVKNLSIYYNLLIKTEAYMLSRVVDDLRNDAISIEKYIGIMLNETERLKTIRQDWDKELLEIIDYKKEG